jgi:hypothetical protein
LTTIFDATLSPEATLMAGQERPEIDASQVFLLSLTKQHQRLTAGAFWQACATFYSHGWGAKPAPALAP